MDTFYFAIETSTVSGFRSLSRSHFIIVDNTIFFSYIYVYSYKMMLVKTQKNKHEIAKFLIFLLIIEVLKRYLMV